MPEASARAMAAGDRDRILATLMEEWSPLQRDLMHRLLLGDDESSDPALSERHGVEPCELRRQRSLARARPQGLLKARIFEEWIP